MSRLNKFVTKLKKNHFIKYGLPFFVLVVGGSFGLREFTQLRYQFRSQQTLPRDEIEKLGLTMKKPGEVTLESEYEKIVEMDIDNWVNIRGPRPWETSDGKQ